MNTLKPIAICASLLTAGAVHAAPILDASNIVGGGAAAFSLQPSNFWAQSFTVGSEGLLSQIDLQIGKFAGATSDVRFEIRPLVDGLPTTTDAGMLYRSSISIDDLPVINSLSDPPPLVSVDVTDAGIHAKPGDEYVISLRRSGGSPVAAWRAEPNSYDDGTGFFRSLLNIPWSPVDQDLGFQAWVDPTPTDPYKYRVDATFDVSYIPGDNVTLVEGQDSLLVGGFFGDPSFPEERPILEFPLDGLPSNAVIAAANLDVDWSASSGSPRIELVGYEGDGLASISDVTAPGVELAVTGPTSASSPSEIPFDAAYLRQLQGDASHLGVRMRSLDAPLYVSFLASEFETSVTLPPRLVVEYTLPAPNADYNRDQRVDIADYTAWRDSLGATGEDLPADGNYDGVVDQADYDLWVDQFGTVLDVGIENGDFETGDLSGWTEVETANGQQFFGFPRVESFDVDGDGEASNAYRTGVGQIAIDFDNPAGAGIQQSVELGAGDYTLSADVAAFNASGNNNSGPGRFELWFDGVLVDVVDMNDDFQGISPGETRRDMLEATLTDVTAGSHTIEILILRPFVLSAAIYQYLDDITISAASSIAVPEPTAAVLLGVLAFGQTSRRPDRRLSRSAC